MTHLAALLQWFCLDCSRIGCRSEKCEHCASNTVWPLQAWLDRKERSK